MPLADGRAYCYAAAAAAPGTRHREELAELATLFGDWRDPIPELLRTASHQQIRGHDVVERARPATRYGGHVGKPGAARTPSHAEGTSKEQARTTSMLAGLSGPADTPPRRAPHSAPVSGVWTVGHGQVCHAGQRPRGDAKPAHRRKEMSRYPMFVFPRAVGPEQAEQLAPLGTSKLMSSIALSGAAR